MSKVIYIAHPVRGAVKKNIRLVTGILRDYIKRSVDIPVAPYIEYNFALKDSRPKERKAGIRCNRYFFTRGFIDEMHLHGSRISKGMFNEIVLAIENNIPVIARTAETQKDLKKFLDQGAFTVSVHMDYETNTLTAGEQ